MTLCQNRDARSSPGFSRNHAPLKFSFRFLLVVFVLFEEGANTVEPSNNFDLDVANNMPIVNRMKLEATDMGSENQGRGPAAPMKLTSLQERVSALSSLRLHWPEYLMETGEMTLYMFFACGFATLMQHPASPIRQLIVGGFTRRGLMGFAIGATVIAIVMSPWGKQSGGHFNPAITFTFYRLGKVASWDALFYVAGQFLGAISGVALATYALRGAPSNDAVRYAVTVPGVYGDAGAFVGELTISFVLMITILFTSNRETLARYTPYFVGAVYAIFMTIEAPLSGMSMNPARTFGSAFPANYWHALWIYFIAPTLGMLVASEVFLSSRVDLGPFCAKLHHANDKRCIFHHG